MLLGTEPTPMFVWTKKNCGRWNTKILFLGEQQHQRFKKKNKGKIVRVSLHINIRSRKKTARLETRTKIAFLPVKTKKLAVSESVMEETARAQARINTILSKKKKELKFQKFNKFPSISEKRKVFMLQWKGYQVHSASLF